MHDTAFQIGALAMNIYADLRSDSVLEVGSQAVNGSLRDNALPSTRYVGIDIEHGDGVDLVIKPGSPFPVEDNSFDLVMASSVFEHDPCFWMTFVEMCRAAKDGGYIYINAPSNGKIHRYPQDNWRFYPDSGKALAAWAASQGHGVTLVESFIAKREKDVWNDFVAVFRKGPIRKSLPKVFIHEHVPCTDVLTWKWKEPLNPTELTEDMVLLEQASQRVGLVETELVETTQARDALAHEVGELNARLAATEEQLQRHAAATQEQLQRYAADSSLRDSELRQRQEEIEQTRSELALVRATHKAEKERLEGDIAALTRHLEEARAAVAKKESELRSISEESRRERQTIQKRLDDRFKEISTLTRLLAEQEERAKQIEQEASWLRETASVLLNDSRTRKGWLLQFLPGAIMLKRQQRMLKRRELFDAEAYLAANTDVAADGADALRHYLKHGVREQRPRA